MVIDVLRFTTSAAYALANGARSIILCETPEEAAAVRRQSADVLLAGERNAVRPSGFDLGNSPLEFTRAAVQGRDLAWTTTNGTRAIAACLSHDAHSADAGIPHRDALTTSSPIPLPPLVPLRQAPALLPVPRSSVPRDLVLASYVNLRAVASLLEPRLLEDAVVAIVCSGREGGFALEDAACAGALVRRLHADLGGALTMNDGARASACIDEAYGEDFARLFRDAQHGRFLRDHGFGADLDACAARDALQVVPRWRDGRFVAG